MLEHWKDYQPTKGQTFWIAVAGIAATLVIGFGFGGWVTAGTSQELISKARSDARQQLAAAVCVENFMDAADAGARLRKLADTAWYERGTLISKAGWATMPDKTEPNSALADACAEKLVTLKPNRSKES